MNDNDGMLQVQMERLVAKKVQLQKESEELQQVHNPLQAKQREIDEIDKKIVELDDLMHPPKKTKIYGDPVVEMY